MNSAPRARKRSRPSRAVVHEQPFQRRRAARRGGQDDTAIFIPSSHARTGRRETPRSNALDRGPPVRQTEPSISHSMNSLHAICDGPETPAISNYMLEEREAEGTVDDCTAIEIANTEMIDADTSHPLKDPFGDRESSDIVQDYPDRCIDSPQVLNANTSEDLQIPSEMAATEESRIPDVPATLSKDVSCRARNILTWQSILSLLLTCGSVRVTVDVFGQFRDWLNWLQLTSQNLSDEISLEPFSLPSYSKLKRKIQPLLKKHCYAKSSVLHFKVDLKRSGARIAATSRAKSNETTAENAVRDSKEAPVLIVMPSEWAILDVSNETLFRSMIGTSGQGGALQNVFDTIEDTPIVQCRRRFLNVGTTISVEPSHERSNKNTDQPNNLPLPVGAGDEVSVTVVLNKKKQGCLEAYGFNPQETELSLYAFHCKISFVVLVQSGSDDISRMIQSRPQNQQAHLWEFFNFGTTDGGCSAIRPGDVVAPLDPPLADGSTTDSFYCIVYRFWQRSVEEKRINLVLSTYQSETLKVRGIGRVRNVSALPSNSTHSKPDFGEYAPSTGMLMDGRRYFVYRMILFCDDFQPHVHRKGGYGGCYMLPLGIRPENRTGSGAVRVLGLTPPGVSSNEVLRAVIPDIVKCSQEGVTGTDPDGNAIVIFLDVVGFIGDYVAVAHALDLRGPTARAPCHLCTYHRDDASNARTSRYGMSTKINSLATSFQRCASRTAIVREGGASEEDLGRLGMKMDRDGADNPLHDLGISLDFVRSSIPLTEHGIPVVPAVFDPYRSCMVAPDHLLSGMAQDIMNAAITFSSPIQRKTAERLILHQLESTNSAKQKKLFTISPPSLLSMTISEMFSVLVVAPLSFKHSWILHEISPSGNQPVRRYTQEGAQPPANRTARDYVLELLFKFQSLVAQTYFLPEFAADGIHAEEDFTRDHGYYNVRRLFAMAADYIESVKTACQEIDGLRAHVDKPNLHRLIELYSHTIPAFGHVRHIQELLFETAHQPLKRSITRSNHRNEQLSAMEGALANDWEARLALEVKCIPSSGKEWNDALCHRLLRLLVGRDVIFGSGKSEYEKLKKAFVPPLLKSLENIRHKLFSFSPGNVFWQLRNECTKAALPSGTQEELSLYGGIVSKAAKLLDEWESSPHDNLCTSKRIYYESAERYRGEKDLFSDGGSCDMERSHARVSPGCFLQTLSSGLLYSNEEAAIINQPDTATNTIRVNDCTRSFWRAITFLSSQHGGSPAGQGDVCFVIVLPCISILKEEKEVFTVDLTSKPHVMRLDHSVREVLAIHACSKTLCSANIVTGKVTHNTTSALHGIFYLIGRREGYPSRVA